MGGRKSVIYAPRTGKKKFSTRTALTPLGLEKGLLMACNIFPDESSHRFDQQTRNQRNIYRQQKKHYGSLPPLPPPKKGLLCDLTLFLCHTNHPGWCTHVGVYRKVYVETRAQHTHTHKPYTHAHAHAYTHHFTPCTHAPKYTTHAPPPPSLSLDNVPPPKKNSQQVIELPVDVPADCHRAPNRLNIGLRAQNLSRLFRCCCCNRYGGVSIRVATRRRKGRKRHAATEKGKQHGTMTE